MFILRRLETCPKGTIGALYLDDDFVCFTLEDPIRVGEKIPGNTAIPSGSYQLAKRKHGRFYEIYKTRWSHQFSIEIMNVHNFTDVLIHTGNDHGDTSGCVLVGFSCDAMNVRVSDSWRAYKYLYKLIGSLEEMPKILIGETWRGNEDGVV